MTTVSVSELYQDPAVQERYATFSFRTALSESMLEVADSVTAQPNILDVLDELGEQDRSAWTEAHHVIAHLPPQTILENYGEAVLVWAATNSRNRELADELAEGLKDLLGYDLDLLDKARQWAYQKKCSTKGRDVLAQYVVMEAVTKGALDDIDLTPLLRLTAKEGVEISDKRAKDYALIPLRAQESAIRADGAERDWSGEVEPDIVYDIWLDAPTGFALTYKGKPNALVAFAMNGLNELMIYQMQGTHGVKLAYNGQDMEQVGTIPARGLAPLEWRDLLLLVTERFASSLGVESLGIQAGKHNKWTTIKPVGRAATEPSLSLEAAARAYDIPAVRHGFTEGEDEHWHKPLTPLAS